MNWYKKAQTEYEIPTISELVTILRNHPLVKNIGKVKNAYLIGSFAKGTQNPQSDMDILIEISPIKNMTAEEFSEKKRNVIRKYFVQHDIRDIDNSIHPQWNGRRLDIYFTYDASTETRPKIKLPWTKNELV